MRGIGWSNLRIDYTGGILNLKIKDFLYLQNPTYILIYI